VHVVTPNKKANSGDLARYQSTLAAAAEGGAKWMVEGTIGAGLPIVSTLRSLRASGDSIKIVQVGITERTGNCDTAQKNVPHKPPTPLKLPKLYTQLTPLRLDPHPP
jgi:hypothetical protein